MTPTATSHARVFAFEDSGPSSPPLRPGLQPSARDLWAGLLDGRWALMDVTSTPRRRTLVARAEPPGRRSRDRLTSSERRVLHRALLGEAEKVIAFELGLAQGTASSHLAHAMRKLRFAGRVDLLRFLEPSAEPAVDGGLPRLPACELRMLRPDVARLILHAPAPRLPVGLSPAERVVCEMVYDGCTNEEVAAARGVGARTVGKQLGRAYRQLGLSGRAELVRRLRAPC